MWPFRKRKTKIFQITWRHDKYYFIEAIRAVDIAAAWAKIRKRYGGLGISLIEWQEVNE